jgi:hypothetical protein
MNNNGWITDRKPTAGDAFDGLVIYWSKVFNEAQVVYYRNIVDGDVWMHITPPEPFMKPKSFRVVLSNCMGYETYEIWDESNTRVAQHISNLYAAKLIAAKFAEVMP